MADNFLERHREDYERRKTEWLKNGRHFKKSDKRSKPEQPEDEAL